MSARVRALAARIEDASHAFVAPIESSFWAEHGISGEEAEQGALVMMIHLGILSEEEGDAVRRLWRKRERAEQRRHVLRRRRALAKMSPTQRKIEAEIQASMRSLVRAVSADYIDSIFRPCAAFRFLRKGGDA